MKHVHTILGYSGLIPFVGLSALTIAGQDGARWMLLSYGALILSFLGGAVWTRSLQENRDASMAIVSNVVVLLAWVALLLNQAISLVLLAVLFSLLFVYEKALLGQEYSAEYQRLRLILTTVVAIALLAAAIFA